METEIIKIDPKKLKDNKNYYDGELEKAAVVINNGGLVAFPTETVYGLGADATNPFASKKIYLAKGRPSDNPLIIHIYDKNQLKEYAIDIPDIAYKIAEKFWPGPLTMILKKSAIIPKETSGGLDTVGIRMPSDEVARAFLKKVGIAVAAPSANISGRPSPTMSRHVIEDMDGKIDMIIDSDKAKIGLESTIVDLSTSVPSILRPGAISLEMLQKIDKNIYIDPAILKKPDSKLKPKAPGMKYRHYAPKAELIILKGDFKAIEAYLKKEVEKQHKSNKRIALILSKENNIKINVEDIKYIGSRSSYEEIANNLFSTLRELDNNNIDIIYSESFENTGIGMAIMNRLTKAAGYNIIEL